jgi:hypothetical protein
MGNFIANQTAGSRVESITRWYRRFIMVDAFRSGVENALRRENTMNSRETPPTVATDHTLKAIIVENEIEVLGWVGAQIGYIASTQVRVNAR